MSSGGGSTTTKSEPWSGQQPYLTDIFNNASNLYHDQSTWPGYYPGTTVAPFNPMELSSIQQQANVAYGPASNMVAQGANAQNFLLGPSLYPQSNPALQQHAFGAAMPDIWGLTTKALPNVRSGAVQAGQYGGSRQGLAEANAIRDTMRTIGDESANIYNNAYNTGLQGMVQAQARTPDVLASMFIPSQMMANAGSAMRGMDQSFYDQYYNRWNYNEWLPYDMLGTFQNLVAGNYGGTSQSSGGQGTNPLQILGTIGQLGLLGKALGLFSDRRLKKNIQRVGTTIGGYPLYTWDYLWGAKGIGVMADEVPEDWTVVGPGGYLMVDYMKVR